MPKRKAASANRRKAESAKVRRVGQLLTVADALEERVEAAERKVERSSQATFAEAFRGDLIR